MMSHKAEINVFTPLPIDMNSDLSTNAQVMNLPVHAREFYFKTFKHKGFNHGLNELRQCHQLSGLDGQGCVILGQPGMGKSRLLRYFATEVYQQPQYQSTDEVTKLPLLSIRVPGRPTILGIIQKLMDCGRYEHPAPRNTDMALKQLYRFIRFTGTEIIIFDEFQHLLRRNALIRTRDVMAFIKVLMDDLCLSVVFTGLPELLILLDEHKEIQERFPSANVELVPFAINNTAGIKEFASYLKNIENNFTRAGYDICSLVELDMIKRLYLATSGIPRRISQLFMRVITQLPEKKVITPKDLDKIFNAMAYNKIKHFALFTEHSYKLEAMYQDLLKKQQGIVPTSNNNHKPGTRLGGS